MHYTDIVFTTAEGLRERKKQKIATQLTESALRLFIVRGFEATTIKDIVAEVDVSPRTFFRYFDSKEDVIVAFSDDLNAELCAALATRPADEPPLTALHRAIAERVVLFAQNRKFTLALLRLINETPSIRARHFDKQNRLLRRLAAELARRMSIRSPHDLRPRLFASVALSALNTALAVWAERNGRGPLVKYIDETFAALCEVARPLRRRRKTANH
jgi:AcrR family transcriptional regulator